MTARSNTPATLRALLLHAAIRLLRRRPPANRRNLASARSILVIKLDAIGDFVLATPFLRELRRSAPSAKISLVTRAITAELASGCVHVDAQAVLDAAPPPRRFETLRRLLRYRRFLNRQFPREKFDFAFVPRTGPDLFFARELAALCGAAVSVGFGPEDRAAPEYTHEIARPPSDVHEVDANLSLLSAVGADIRSSVLDIGCPPDAEAAVDVLLAEEGIPSPLLVLGVGASLPHKVWPADRFFALGEHFARNHHAHVVAIGDSRDRLHLPDSDGYWHNWAGKLSLAESYGLLRRADLFIGNDSAALHLAAAAGCPSVVISWDHREPETFDVNSHLRFQPRDIPFVAVHAPSEAPRSCQYIPLSAVLGIAEGFFMKVYRSGASGDC